MLELQQFAAVVPNCSSTEIARERYDVVCARAKAEIAAAEDELARLVGPESARELPDLDTFLAEAGGRAGPRRSAKPMSRRSARYWPA